MIKTVLAPATGGDSDAATLASALTIAREFGAHVDVLHVRIDAAATALAMTMDAGSGAFTAGLIGQLEAEAREREAKAADGFRRFCADAGLAVADTPTTGGSSGPSAAWHVETGDEARWIATYGLTADLIIAPRRRDSFGDRAVVESALFGSGKPLLIPADATIAPPPSSARIAIGWKATPQAARAVELALPFLARAKEIVVLTVGEQGEEQPDRIACLLRQLAWHGLVASSAPLAPGPNGAAATLLSAACGRADLLVMGGYGHSRVREWVFGGFTQTVLADAPLPVLIAH
jgi:nucleotide-binding universal stress UspA family protein